MLRPSVRHVQLGALLEVVQMVKASVDDKVVDVITADDGTVWEFDRVLRHRAQFKSTGIARGRF
jgi:hypothetical protein